MTATNHSGIYAQLKRHFDSRRNGMAHKALVSSPVYARVVAGPNERLHLVGVDYTKQPDGTYLREAAAHWVTVCPDDTIEIHRDINPMELMWKNILEKYLPYGVHPFPGSRLGTDSGVTYVVSGSNLYRDTSAAKVICSLKPGAKFRVSSNKDYEVFNDPLPAVKKRYPPEVTKDVRAYMKKVNEIMPTMAALVRSGPHAKSGYWHWRLELEERLKEPLDPQNVAVLAEAAYGMYATSNQLEHHERRLYGALRDPSQYLLTDQEFEKIHAERLTIQYFRELQNSRRLAKAKRALYERLKRRYSTPVTEPINQPPTKE